MTSAIRQCRHGRSSFDSILSDMAFLTFADRGSVGRSLASRALNPRGSGNRGGPERARTSDLLFRKTLVFPTEIRDQWDNLCRRFSLDAGVRSMHAPSVYIRRGDVV